MKTDYKVGDRVRAVKDCRNGSFKKGEIMSVEGIYHAAISLTGDTVVYPDEIELIEAEPKERLKIRNSGEWILPDGIEPIDPDTVEVPRELAGQTAKIHENALRMFARANAYAGDKPFPTFEEFHEWYRTEQGNMQGVYHYFAQFGVREVFPEVGKEYEFSEDGENWIKDIFESYESNNSIGFTHIRPIQPSRLEQLKAKHPNLTNDELIELLDILLTQMRNTQ